MELRTTLPAFDRHFGFAYGFKMVINITFYSVSLVYNFVLVQECVNFNLYSGKYMYVYEVGVSILTNC